MVRLAVDADSRTLLQRVNDVIIIHMTIGEPIEPTAERGIPFRNEHLDYAFAFYGSILDAYSAALATEGDHTAATQAWETANVYMAEFALDRGDFGLASRCYGYIQDPAKKWSLVAAAYHSNAIWAVEWQVPLHDAIQQGQYSTYDILAMRKAEASMAFDRVKTHDGNDRKACVAEAHGAIAAAMELLDAKIGDELAPRNRHGHSYKGDIPPEQDVRSHMLDLAKLCAENGDFVTARAIAKRIERVTSDASSYSGREGSIAAAQKSKEFIATLQLRELCYGLVTADAVIRAARRWKYSETNNACTRRVGELLTNRFARTGDSPYTEGVVEALLFIEEKYPQIKMRYVGTGPAPMYQHALEVHLKAGEWSWALSQYTHRLQVATDPLEQLRNALLVARHEQDLTAVAAAAAADVSRIRDLVAEWTAMQNQADTSEIPAIREGMVVNLRVYASKNYGITQLQCAVLHELLDAEQRIDPTGGTIRAAARSYVTTRLQTLQHVPDYEQTAVDEIAVLFALFARVGE